MKNHKTCFTSCIVFFVVSILGTYSLAEEDSSNSFGRCYTDTYLSMKSRLDNWGNPRTFPKNFVLVMLGGGLSRSCDAIDVYHRFKPAKIIVSDKGEAAKMRQILINGGVPADIIVKESKATNTAENAIYVNEVIHNHFKIRPPVVLYTDKWHMTRAEGFFSAYGFPVDSYWGASATAGLVGNDDHLMCGRVTPRANPYSKLVGEARSYSENDLCYQRDPEFKEKPKNFAMSRRLTNDQFLGKCQDLIEDSQYQSLAVALRPSFCTDAINSIHDNFSGFENTIDCLTMAKTENWNHSQIEDNCTDETFGEILAIPKNYVYTLLGNSRLLNQVLDFADNETHDLATRLSNGPNSSSLDVKGHQPSNAQLTQHLESSIKEVRAKKTLLTSFYLLF